jgi:hypothetical protein
MRVMLAILAVIGLLATPVTAAAVQAACDQAGPMAKSGMAILATDQPGAMTSGSSPCCHQAEHHSQKRDTNCAQACATSCSVAAALTTLSDGPLLASTPAILTPARAVSRDPYEPAGLRRPPKSIA